MPCKTITTIFSQTKEYNNEISSYSGSNSLVGIRYYLSKIYGSY